MVKRRRVSQEPDSLKRRCTMQRAVGTFSMDEECTMTDGNGNVVGVEILREEIRELEASLHERLDFAPEILTTIAMRHMELCKCKDAIAENRLWKLDVSADETLAPFALDTEDSVFGRDGKYPIVAIRPQMVPREEWQLAEEDVNIDWGRMLGTGTHGDVLEGTFSHFGSSALAVAVKVATLGCPGVRRLQNEIDLLRGLQHPAIVRTRGWCLSDYGELMLVMERMDGTLGGVLGTEEMTWQRALDVTSDVAGAIAFLHSQSPAVIHRDIKPTNLCLDKTDDFRWRCKLIDFGEAATVEGRRSVLQSNPGVGSPAFMSPEAAMGSYGTSVDLWSFGVVMLCCESNEPLVTAPPSGSVPYLETQPLGAAPAAVAVPFSDLARACASASPAARPTADLVHAKLLESRALFLTSIEEMGG